MYRILICTISFLLSSCYVCGQTKQDAQMAIKNDIETMKGKLPLNIGDGRTLFDVQYDKGISVFKYSLDAATSAYILKMQEKMSQKYGMNLLGDNTIINALEATYKSSGIYYAAKAALKNPTLMLICELSGYPIKNFIYDEGQEDIIVTYYFDYKDLELYFPAIKSFERKGISENDAIGVCNSYETFWQGVQLRKEQCPSIISDEETLKSIEADRYQNSITYNYDLNDGILLGTSSQTLKDLYIDTYSSIMKLDKNTEFFDVTINCVYTGKKNKGLKKSFTLKLSELDK